jgi:hypothetical protein
VTVLTERPLSFDAYSENRSTGSFILIDPITNETAGAGMITKAAAARAATERVSAGEREARNGHRPAVVVAANDEMAARLERRLFDAGVQGVWWQGNAAAVSPLCAAGAVVILTGDPGVTIAGVKTIDVSGEDGADFEKIAGRVLREIAAA